MTDKAAEKRMVTRLFRVSVGSIVRAACVATLLSLALMCWSVLDPTPMPVMVSMSVGQAIGSLALVAYAVAVLVYTVQQRRDRDSDRPKT